MALDVEGVIGGCVGGEKSLRGSHALEPLHLPLPSSGWLMRILRSIVAPSATLVAFCDSQMTGCGGIRSQLICDELVGEKAIFLQQLAHQFKRRPRLRPDAKSYGVWAGGCAGPLRPSARNGSPSAGRSHRRP